MILVTNSILYCRILAVQLSREIGLRDHGIVWRKMVALEAERADPDLGGEINAREAIHDGCAGFATERKVRESWDFWVRTNRGD
jgi:hypothetical protein